MDNLTHSLLGAALAHTGLNRRLWIVARDDLDRNSPCGRVHAPSVSDSAATAITSLLVLSSNLPDVDSVAALASPLFFLEHHRGYTHTFWGVVLLALLAPFPFLKWNRPIREIPVGFWRKYRYLFLVSLAGTASHLLLDCANAYGVRPIRPLGQRWMYGDFIAIVDPWIYLILGSAIFLIRSRGRAGLLLWIGGIGLLSVAVWSYGRDMEPDPLRIMRIVWFVVVAVVFLLRGSAAQRLRARSRSLAIGGLLVLAGYALFCWQLHHLGLSRLSRHASGQPESASPSAIAAMAVPGNPFLWNFVREAGEHYYSGLVDAATGSIYSERLTAKNLDGLAFRKALETCSGKVLMRFARFPFLQYRPEREGWIVVLADLRFGNMPGRFGFASEQIYFDRIWRERPEARPR
ncbi:MAG: metal-dependent hydrolase, partial [Acidobacteria bacterium]|nr:metal-dependent hydrolase [Acidobacteriota bacterium]